MKTEIKDKKYIEILINAFYEKVKVDNTICFFFTDAVKVNWEQHLQVMHDFWESVVFHKGICDGNPIETHIDLNKKSSMKMEHFQRWTQLFNDTADKCFAGAKVDLIKKHAFSIATVIQIKTFR